MTHLCEVCQGIFDEWHSSLVDHAGIDSKAAGNVAGDKNENEFDSEAKHAFISDHFQGFDVILGQKFLLEDELEAIGEKGANEQDVSDDLQTRVSS